MFCCFGFELVYGWFVLIKGVAWCNLDALGSFSVLGMLFGFAFCWLGGLDMTSTSAFILLHFSRAGGHMRCSPCVFLKVKGYPNYGLHMSEGGDFLDNFSMHWEVLWFLGWLESLSFSNCPLR